MYDWLNYMSKHWSYDKDYFKKDPVRYSEKAFRSYFISMLAPVFRRNKHLIDGSGKKGLDMGCGEGHGVKILSEFGYIARGVDISPFAIERAKSNYPELSFYRVDITENIRKKLNSRFDLVICVDVLEHLSNPLKAIKNIYEVLYDGGTAVISFPNKASPFVWFFVHDNTHCSVRSIWEWRETLEKFEWSENELFVRQYFPLSWKILGKFEFFDLPIFGSQIVFKLKK